ncbi:Phage Integrase-like Recombinase [Pleurotus pulmonarius]
MPSIHNPDHIILTLPASKTDPFRKGVTIYIASAPDSPSTCPVSALVHLFTINPLPPNSPLFTTSDQSPLTRSRFIARLRLALLEAGFQPHGFSGHSFRRGAASAAAAAGFLDHEIQQLGRWRSDAYRLYIDTPKDRILNLSSRLHMADPHASTFEPPSLRFTPSLA